MGASTSNLFTQEPSANVAITHDDVWISFLEEVGCGDHSKSSSHLPVPQELLQPGDLAQDGRLEALVSQKYDIVLEEGGF